MKVLGIDIGSYGIKGAVVDTVKGEIISGKKSTDKLEDTRPHKIISKVHKLVKKFDWKEPIVCAFPAAIHKGRVLSAHRIDTAWDYALTERLFSEISSCPVKLRH